MSVVSKTANDQLVRDLGVSEDIIDALNGIGAYLFSVVLFLDMKKTLTRDALEATLSILQQRHPLLRSFIRTQNGQRRFEPMEHATLDFEMTEAGSSWESVYERMLTELIDTERGPLWRVRTVPMENTHGSKERHAIVFVLHHSMSDGIGTASLMSQFAEILDKYMTNESPDGILSQSFPLMPAMENIMSDSDVNFTCLDIPSLMSIAGDMMFPAKNQYLKRYPAQCTLDAHVKTATKVLRFSLSQADTQNLLKACKSKKVTVHGALTSAASMAAAMIMDEKKSHKIRSRHTVDMRRNIEPMVPAHHMAYLVSTIETALRIKSDSSTTFWGYAKKANKVIQRAIYLKDYMKPIRIANKLYSRTAFLKKMEQVSRTNGGRDDKHFTLTNLGNFDHMFGDIKTENFEVVDLLVATGVHVLGPVFLHNVTTFHGQLRWNLSYSTSVTSTENAVKYLHAIHMCLVQALKEASATSL